jgi:hypothetical protein
MGRRSGVIGLGLALAVTGALLASEPASAATRSTFVAVADAHVSSAAPRRNFGAAKELRVDRSPRVRSYLAFKVQGLSGKVGSAKLYLYARSGSRSGYVVRATSGAHWSERRVTYANAPSLSSKIGSSGSFRRGTWTAVDVTPLVEGDGLISLALTTSTRSEIRLASSEAARKPRLKVKWDAALPPPAPSGSIYWGSFIDGDETYGAGYGDAPWDQNTWNLFEQHAGKKVSILHYGQPPPWVDTFYAGVADIVTGRGAIPMISMSTRNVPLTDVASGRYDASIASWAQKVKAWGKPFFLRFNWEMNGTWFSWGAQAKANPASFVAAWRHFHDVVVAQGATNVTWVWCPNLEYDGSTPLEQVYPGDAYVDWTGLDGYNKGESSHSFASIYQASYNRLLQIAPSKPIMVGEVSSIEYGLNVKASWTTDALSVLATSFPKIRAFVWFNWRFYQNGWLPFQIESSASAQQAFHDAIGSSYFRAGGSLGPLPTLAKVPLP